MGKESKVNKAKDEAAFYGGILEQIQREKPFAEELSKYPAEQVAGFYESLADLKLFYLKSGKFYYDKKQSVESEWVETATDGLKEIQIKKVFDQHCLWDAGKLTLPGIAVNMDFYIHYKAPFNCPFIDPISDADYAIYIDYLKSNNYRMGDDLDMLRYEDIRAIDKRDEEDCIPEWFDFHNGRTGKGVYLSFPMARTEKEMFYRCFKSKMQDNKAEAVPKTEPNLEQQPTTGAAQTPSDVAPLPSIPHWDRKQIEFFVNSFEDKKTQAVYRKYQKMTKAFYESEYDFQEMMATLSQHGEIWPIKAHHDWREAFHNCYLSYKQHKIAEAMPLAYEQYKMYLEMKIPFELDAQDVEFGKHLSRIVRAQVLEGRRLNGEPADFNY